MLTRKEVVIARAIFEFCMDQADKQRNTQRASYQQIQDGMRHEEEGEKERREDEDEGETRQMRKN